MAVNSSYILYIISGIKNQYILITKARITRFFVIYGYANHIAEIRLRDGGKTEYGK